MRNLENVGNGCAEMDEGLLGQGKELVSGTLSPEGDCQIGKGDGAMFAVKIKSEKSGAFSDLEAERARKEGEERRQQLISQISGVI
jgi:hypothetical protein